MDDELRERRVERPVREREALGRRALDVDRGMPLPRGGDERLGRVDRRDCPGADARDDLTGEHARAAADIEDPHSAANPRKIGHLRRQQ